MIGQGVDGIGALVRRKKSGEWAEAELLYEGNGTEDGR